ncbi:MAG: hypothetical protein JNM55_10535 [Anaerolineales bacterium]|nr:hypothetical protein [Anaerolineales bacterium]
MEIIFVTVKSVTREKYFDKYWQYFYSIRVFKFNRAQQSVHWTLGILAQSQAVFYASAFFRSDGFAVIHPSASNANRWVLGNTFAMRFKSKRDNIV